MRTKGHWFWGFYRVDKGSGTSGNYGHKGVKNAPWGKGGSAPGGGHGAIGLGADLSEADRLRAINTYREWKAKKTETKKEKPKAVGTPGKFMDWTNDQKADAFLGKGLFPEDDWRTANSSGVSLSVVTAEIANKLADQSGLPGAVVSPMIDTWKGTSNDTNLRALSFQEAVSEEFGVPLSDWQKGQIKYAQQEDKAGHISPYQKPILDREQERTLARTMYDATQADLAAAGYKPGDKIKLFRGVGYPWSERDNRPEKGQPAALNQNTISSWSLDFQTADGFAMINSPGIVISMEVPIENIFSTGRTGFGTFGEGEFVVLGTPGNQAMVQTWE